MINGAKVKELRLAKRLSQAELASASGISQTQLSRIETGQGDTTTGILLSISGALGLSSAEELLANPPVSRKVAAKVKELRKSGAMSPCSAGV